MMAHVDLCSGIGGFALGFQWAGLSKPVLFCDIEPWSRKVLHKHWPDVPIATDVKELASDPDRNVPDCDILTAGYPCQPFSHAGKRLGHADDRHIWPYLLQIVAQKRPAWCVFENVYGHVSMGLDQVLSDLETQGYATRPFIVPACAVDAPHRRDRIWIIAHTDSHREPNGPVNGSQEQRLQASADDANTDSQRPYRAEQHEHGGGESADGKERDTGQVREVLAGQRNAEERTAKDVGNTSSSGQHRDNGRWAGQKPENRCEDVADTDSPRCKEQRRSQPAQPKHQAPQCGSGWLTEPSVGRVAYGIPKRVDRLKGLGNAIVPQIAMKIGEAIKQCEAEL